MSKRVKATIQSIDQSTPTIKSFSLFVGKDFVFLPGQWVDFFLPDEVQAKHSEIQIAGYSMTNSPSYTNRTGLIELSIKNTRGHVITDWLYDEAKEGDVVEVEGGQGDFYFTKDLSKDVVLIAAGIGVTPLLSILNYINETEECSVLFLYNAKSTKELLHVSQWSQFISNPRVECVCGITESEEIETTDLEIVPQRIGKEIIQQKASKDALYYISGPNSMITSYVELLKELEIPQSQYRFELW